MKTQIISNKKIEVNSTLDCVVSSLNKPVSLDCFDVNVILLQDENLWKNQKASNTELNCTNDFISISKMLENTTKSTNIIALPQNYIHGYHYRYGSGYQVEIALKDEMNNLIHNLLAAILPYNLSTSIDLIYENSITDIGNKGFISAFTFINSCGEVISKSRVSEKSTTIKVFDNLYLTTLDLLSDSSSIYEFIKGIGLEKEKTEYPQWLLDFECLDDKNQREVIKEKQEIVVLATAEIDRANKKLDDNLKYKSILVTNGNELVSVVFEMLEVMLSCDLSDFIDKKREDFVVKKDSVTFVGEIKGVNTNVKNDNISQSERHKSSYLDELEEHGKEENVKPLLIITPLRKTPLENREPVNEKQIALAKKYDVLIITTDVFLHLYEKFTDSKITNKEIESIFEEKTGILQITDF